MSRTGALTLAVLVAGLVASAVEIWPARALEPTAQADRRGRRPTQAQDIDEDQEQHSGLWERVLHPQRKRYQALVERARMLAEKKRDNAAMQEARAVLEQAARLVPDQPEAHWLLGRMQEDAEDWSECAASYRQVLAVQPGYQPTRVPAGRKPPWAVAMGLAMCHAHTGNPGLALEHLERIVGRGHGTDPEVLLRLGETYMALGRLREAIATLELALRYQPNRWRASFSLAVAYDRDEQDQPARMHMENALRQDRHLLRILAPDQTFAPAANRLYYLGLAHAHQGAFERSIVYFRRYLHETGMGPWRLRAAMHLEQLGREPFMDPARIQLASNQAVDKRRITRAVMAVADELVACVAPAPNLLIEVKLTAVGQTQRSTPAQPIRGSGTGPSPRGRGAARAVLTMASGVKADVLHGFATAPEQAAQVQACVEAAAGRIALPRPKGDISRYISVRFLLIAR